MVEVLPQHKNNLNRLAKGVRDFLWRSYLHEPRPKLPPFSDENQVTLLVNGNEILPAMLDIITQAQHSIRWHVMLFRPDEAGSRLADALSLAAQRGVQVQLSFDMHYVVNGTPSHPPTPEQIKKSQTMMDALLETFKAAGIQVKDSHQKVYQPLSPEMSSTAQAQHITLQNHVVMQGNHYDHRKFLIVDESLAILGGTNVGNEYLYLEPPDLTCDMTEEAEQTSVEPWEKWEDAAVQLYGEAVKILTRQFDLHWEQLGGTPLPLQQPPLDSIQQPTAVSILYQQPGYGEIAAAYLEWIEQAKESLWVASPYICYPDVLKTLAKASQRGVRVVMLYPNQHNDIPVEVDVFEQHIPTLIQAGVEIYENCLRMAHYKLMIVDHQRCLLGSFNLNYRSFRHDIEVNAAIDNADFAAELKSRIFEPGIARARRVTGKRPPSLPLLTRLVIEPFL